MRTWLSSWNRAIQNISIHLGHNLQALQRRNDASFKAMGESGLIQLKHLVRAGCDGLPQPARILQVLLNGQVLQ